MFLTSSLLLWLFLWNPFIRGSEINSNEIRLIENLLESNDYTPLLSDEDHFDDLDLEHRKNGSPTESAINVSINSTTNDSPFQPFVFDKNLRSAEIQNLLDRKLREIFTSQFPTKRYSLRAFYIENLPEGVDLLRKRWSKSDMEKINANLPLLKFRKRSQHLTWNQEFGLDQMKCLTEAELDMNLTFENGVKPLIIERFKAESGLIDSDWIDWRLLDRSAIPEKYNEVPLNSGTFKCSLVFHNREIIENIHFHLFTELDNFKKRDAQTRSNTKDVPIQKEQTIILKNRHTRSKNMKSDLRNLFKSQHPGKRYILNDYEILNWPSTIDVKKKEWSHEEMDQIEKVFNEIQFISKELIFHAVDEHKDVERQNETDSNYGFEIVRSDLDFKLDQIFISLLDRFKSETGDTTAEYIQWNLLDRSQLPLRYSNFLKDSTIISASELLKCIDVIDYIHFNPSHKRVFSDMNGDEGIDADELYELMFSDEEIA